MPVLTPASAPETAQAAPAAANPFVRAAIEHTQPFHDQSTVLAAASSTRVGPIDVAAYGFMRNIVLLVTGTGGTGGTLAADGPWSLLDAVSIEDVNGRPIVSLTGHDLYLANKWGGYRFGNSDPAIYPSFSAVVTAPAFKVLVPIELTPRDSIGSLPNLTASQTYKLSYTIAPASSAYSVNPSVMPTIRVRAWLEAWSQPAPTDSRGVPNETEPPYLGTTQYWTKAVYPITAGENRIQLKRVGNLLRNLVLVYRLATAGAPRDAAGFPSTYRFEMDSRILENSDRALWLDQMRDRWDLTPDAGVFVKSFTHDGDGRPGNETRHLYLPTSGATRLEFIGSFAAAGTLHVLTNDVAPQGGAMLASGYAR